MQKLYKKTGKRKKSKMESMIICQRSIGKDPKTELVSNHISLQNSITLSFPEQDHVVYVYTYEPEDLSASDVTQK